MYSHMHIQAPPACALTHALYCQGAAHRWALCSAWLQAVQGDPVSSGMLLLGRWKVPWGRGGLMSLLSVHWPRRCKARGAAERPRCLAKDSHCRDSTRRPRRVWKRPTLLAKNHLISCPSFKQENEGPTLTLVQQSPSHINNHNTTVTHCGQEETYPVNMPYNPKGKMMAAKLKSRGDSCKRTFF